MGFLECYIFQRNIYCSQAREVKLWFKHNFTQVYKKEELRSVHVNRKVNCNIDSLTKMSNNIKIYLLYFKNCYEDVEVYYVKDKTNSSFLLRALTLFN